MTRQTTEATPDLFHVDPKTGLPDTWGDGSPWVLAPLPKKAKKAAPPTSDKAWMNE